MLMNNAPYESYCMSRGERAGAVAVPTEGTDVNRSTVLRPSERASESERSASLTSAWWARRGGRGCAPAP